MIRTIVSLDREHKEWLDRRAEMENVSMAELIRIAVREYRERTPSDADAFDALLERTRGIWTGPEALAHQRALRSERRPRS